MIDIERLIAIQVTIVRMRSLAAADGVDEDTRELLRELADEIELRTREADR